MKKLSLVVPMMNEEANVEPLFKAVREALKDIDYEFILVDDGSTDKTVEKMKELCDEKTKIIIFNRNFGQTTAMAAGIKESSGELIATIDGDLQNDPTDIPWMIEKLENEDGMLLQEEEPIDKMVCYLEKSPAKLPIISLDEAQVFI